MSDRSVALETVLVVVQKQRNEAHDKISILEAIIAEQDERIVELEALTKE